MSTYLSTYVQKTEELYFSRSLKFHDGNMWKWIDIMKLTDGMDILEVGCAGGCLCHRIKEYLPNVNVNGLDFDAGHIEFAKRKSEELKLPCNFTVGDAMALPFEDNSFDICLSHTVICFCEPTKFIGGTAQVFETGRQNNYSLPRERGKRSRKMDSYGGGRGKGVV